jgi:hypothetical protein
MALIISNGFDREKGWYPLRIRNMVTARAS